MSFRFRKLYADLVTAGGDVCIVYLARLRLLGLRLAMSAVEYYPADGARETVRVRGAARLPDFATDREPEIRVALPAGDFVLRYRATLPPWIPGGPPPHPGLRWHVAIPCGEAVAKWPGGAMLRGRGYADWVEIDTWPRSLGLRRLHWGRVHAGGDTVVFTALEFASGAKWTRAGEWSAAGLREWEEAEIGDGGGSTCLRLPDSWHGQARELRLSPQRTLHSGPALNGGRFPSTVERMGMRLLAGPMAEARWLSEAGGSSPTNCPCGALHERVRFGGSASNPTSPFGRRISRPWDGMRS